MKKQFESKDYVIFGLSTLLIAALSLFNNKTVELVISLVLSFLVGTVIAHVVDFFKYKKLLTRHPDLLHSPDLTVMRDRLFKWAGKHHRVSNNVVGMALMNTGVMYIHNMAIAGAIYFSLRMFLYVKSNTLLSSLSEQEKH